MTTAIAPLKLTATEVAAEAAACASDVKLFAATLKRYLKARTGLTFSVRSAGRGTGREWVRVCGTGSQMTALEDATLRALFPNRHAVLFGLNIDRRERTEFLHVAAGVAAA